MKILFSPCHYVYEDHIGGSELSWAFNLADKLSNIYPDSTVITGFKDLSKTKRYKIIELQKNKKIYDRSVKNAVIFNIKYTINTNKIIKNEHFDIIHHVLPFFINRTFNLSKNKNIPFVIGPIQSPLEYKDKDFYSNNHQNKYLYKKINWIFSFSLFPFNHIVKKLSKNTLLKADKLIVINNHTKDLITKMGIESEKIEVIAPGIDTKKFKYYPVNKKNFNTLELITVGYLLERKGIDLVLRALKEVTKKYNKVILRILGNGPQKENLINLTKELGLENNVIFEGFIPNDRVCKFYKKSHIFVSMSRYESWGQMYLEAMACGLPVLTSRNIGSLEMIKEGYNGYLINQEDYKTLAKKIIYLIKNKDRINKLSINCRKNAEEKYDWDLVIIPQYLKIYRELLKK